MQAIIETERLILREFRPEDYEAVYEFNSNTELHKYTGDEIVSSLERAKEIIEQIWLKDYATYGYGRWAVVHKADQKIIGFAGLKYLPEIGETDIGYRFLPEYWGKGIASEAAKPILAYGFNTLKLKRVIGFAMPENIASCKVLEKIGLTFYKQGEYAGDGKAYNWYEIHKTPYKKIPFDDVKTSIEQILSYSGSKSWELLPDHIHELAAESGIKLEWEQIKEWPDIEYGNSELEDHVLLDAIFHKIKPSGSIRIITDECFKDREAYQLEKDDLAEFIAEVYPEKYEMDFFQPMDYLFICPDIQMITILHHEGHVTQYQKQN